MKHTSPFTSILTWAKRKIRHTKLSKEIKTDGIHLNNGVSVDDFEKLEELKISNKNKFESSEKKNFNTKTPINLQVHGEHSKAYP